MLRIITSFLIFFFAFSPFLTRAQSWSALGIGLDSTCRALEVDKNGNVYAGGDFRTAMTSFGDVKEVNYIARWNGSQWLTLGKGLDGPVYAIAMDRNNRFLYVGGYFQRAYQSNGIFINASNVARWDKLTGNWSALGDGFDGSCLALYIDENNTVYAGGNFDKSGSTTLNNIAKWDGSAWQPLGSGLGGWCQDIIKDKQSNLYAGGNIWSAGGIPVDGIAMWNGNIWVDFAPGITGGARVVYSMSFDGNGDLYVGGWFQGAGAVSSANILRWDGDQWNGVGNGLNSVVYGLATDSMDNIFIAGPFDSVAGNLLTLNHVAYWNGNWNALGSGTDDWCKTLSVAPDGSVLVGGGFQLAGNVEARRIARWTPAWVGQEERVEDQAMLRLYPLPAREVLRIESASTFRPGEQITLQVYGTDGRLLHAEQVNADKTLILETASFAPGFYLLNIRNGDKSITRPFIKE